jgi:hypothetical protein
MTDQVTRLVRRDDLAEHFCLQHNISIEDFNGRRFGNTDVSRADPYCLFAGEYFPAITDALKVTGVKIDRALRFSNSLIQLSNAINVAEHLAVERIYVPDFFYLDKTSFKIDPARWLINDSRIEGNSSRDLILTGRYFYTNTLLPILRSPQPTRFDTLSRAVPCFNLDCSPRSSFSEDDLVIHVRSGDVFSDKPHPLYGQPPLAFYRWIVDARDWRSVAICFEDSRNPVIEHLVNYCRRKCRVVTEKSGDLRSDIEFLLKAKSLVSSRGTFIPGIASISGNIRTIFAFEDFSHWGNPAITVVSIRDLAGEYRKHVLSKNWANSEEQRRLMIDYPLDHVGAEEAM